MDQIQTIRIVIDARGAKTGSDDVRKGLRDVQQETERAASALARMEKVLGSVGGYMKAQLALYAAEVAGKLLAAGKAAFDFAAGLDELAEQLGVTAKGLQGLQFAAVQNGVKLEQLETGVAKFSQKMGEAADGSKEMIDALTRIGVKNLDLQGKLRPTEELLQDVAKAILAVDDPAKRAAAAVDFFGKAGTRMLPLLSQIAEGTDAMGAAAQRAGAMISRDAIKRLDELADSMERGKVKTRAFVAEGLAGILDFLDHNDFAQTLGKFFNANLVYFGEIFPKKLGDTEDSLRTSFDNMVVAGAGFVARFLEQFKALPEQLGKLFVDGMNAAIAGLEGGLNRLSSGLANSSIGQRLGLGGIGEVSLGRVEGGGASFSEYSARVGAAGQSAEATMRANGYGRDYATLRAQARMEQDETRARAGGGPYAGAPGAFTSTAKGAGDDVRKRLEKLDRDTSRDVASATAYVEASERGARAVAELEVHFKALKAAQDAYGDTADKNKAQVDALTGKLEAQYRAEAMLKNLKDFNLDTQSLEKQNELLAAENSLFGASVEVRARELALIKLRQETEAKGLDASNTKEREAIERRKAAIEQNETLKAQAEQMKQVNELWTAPLKQALQNIQTTGADMWETILETGKFSAQSLGDLFIKTARRIAAEFLALATIRPVMSVVVQGLGGLGLVSPGMAQQLGFPMGGGGGASASSGGGGLGGFGNLFGGGGSSGGMLGGLGTWLNTPFTGGFSGVANLPQGVMGPAANTAVGGLSGTGGGLFSGMTPGSIVGGLGSIGMGAYGLLKGGGSTASTIGSIGQMVGGVVSMIPGLQPIGMGISLLSTFLPGLFGGGGEQRPPQPGLDYSMGGFYGNGAGGFNFSGNSLGGGSSLSGTARSLGGGVMSLFRQAGLKAVPGGLYGGEIASGTDHTWGGNAWQNRPYTQTSLTLPGGGIERLTYDDANMDPQRAAEYLLTQVFKANVLRGGVSGASDTLKTSLRGIDPSTQQDLQNVIALSAAYDKLGKTVNPVKDSIEKLSTSFDELRDFATQAGLSMQPITDELEKQTKRTAQDFIDSMLDPLAVQMRALDDERQSALASAEYIRDNVKDVYVDMDRIATYYTKKESDLRDQFYGGAVASLQDAINRLTFGDLSNLSPSTTLAGIQGTYSASLAKARALDPGAISGFAGLATNYGQVANQFFASGPQYQAIKDQILRDVLEVQSLAQGGGGSAIGGANDNNAATQASLSNVVALQGIVEEQSRQIADLTTKFTQAMELLQRVATNR